MPAHIFIAQCFLLIITCLPYHSVVANTPSFLERHSEQRQSYLELNELLKNGELDAVKSRRAEIENYPLADYLDFLLLKKEIERHAQPASLLGRVAQMKHDKRIHRKLLSAVKNRSAKLERWEDYQKASAGENVPVHPCDDMMAGFKTSSAMKFSKSIGDLWADPARHTARCDEAFDLLLSSVSDVPTGALWRRSVALLKRGELDGARTLLKYFNKRDRRIVEAWTDGLKEPEKLLPSSAMRGDSVHHQEMATLLLRGWARNDLVAASEFWRANARRFGFSERRIQDTLARYAVLAAKRGLPESLELLNNVEPDRDVRYWRVRLALQERDWKRSLALLDELTDKEKKESRWKYWRARSLESQGYKAAAAKIYESIAGSFDYYGFLAADRLSSSYPIKVNRPLVNMAQVESLWKSEQIARAVEFFLVGVSWEGRREWNQVLKSASKEKLIAAANVAQSVGWHDRALAAMISASEPGALDALFPSPYSSTVGRNAEQYAVEREFIYGVMRRESLFIADIKSSAGAVGLMQLMPATARQMGKELGVKAPKWRLIDGEFNIKLGVKYLNHLMGRFDNNMVLTAAAYNAGPSRVNKWMADGPVAADLWVETIPFDETRAYVKAVLFNTIVSQWSLNGGAITPLKHRMPDVTPAG